MVEIEREEKKTVQDNEFGWEFHRGPIIAAILITVVFYILVFAYVAID